MAISDALVTAHKNLQSVIPRPLTAEEEAERVRTGGWPSKVNPKALHDAARRFVDAFSKEPAAAVELKRRGTLCASLTGEGSKYFVAMKNAQAALSAWDVGTQFAQNPDFLNSLQGAVRNLLQLGSEGVVEEVRVKYEKIKTLLGVNGVPEAVRAPLESWRDAAWEIVSKGENESLDGCYWLLHADELQRNSIASVWAPEVRQAADALMRWLENGGDGAPSSRDENLVEKWQKWALNYWPLAVIIVGAAILAWIVSAIESISNLLDFFCGN